MRLPPKPPSRRPADPAASALFAAVPPHGRAYLHELVQLKLIDVAAIPPFLTAHRAHLARFQDRSVLGQALVHAKLLTAYQLGRVEGGKPHGLVLGGYRVLERIGAGSIGIVFLGEHILLKRRAAIKVLPVDDSLPPAIIERFFAEMRVLAELHHPHVVMAYDAGRYDPPPQQASPSLLYLVLELVTGGDLENRIADRGPAGIAQACEWARQAAAGLQEAHDHHLIHRDLKPSNLLLAADGTVKLVDFGLARQFSSGLTDPNSLLGSIEFMAPEQSIDPSGVDGRADIYALAATLFYTLTGEPPYPVEPNVAKAVQRLQTEDARRLRDFRNDIPPELDTLVALMLSRDPARRPALPVTAMQVLARFTTPPAPRWEIDGWVEDAIPRSDMFDMPPVAPTDAVWRVLVATADADRAALLRDTLDQLGCVVDVAADADAAHATCADEPVGLLLADLHLPGGGAYPLCDRLRERPPRPHLKVLLLADSPDPAEFAEAILRGADDFAPAPFDLASVAAKVQSMMRLKDAQDRTDQLARHLVVINRQLRHRLGALGDDVRQAHEAMLFAMARMAESRDGETPGHLRRVTLYSLALAEALTEQHPWSVFVDAAFLDTLAGCAGLHDIGKVAVPDAVLLKPGPLEPAERTLMETHTTAGCDMLSSIGKEYGGLTFLGMARAIVRHHHERYDGTGYPDRLGGDAIPPAARLVALADVYDALRRKRSHKPALSHVQAVRAIEHEMPGAFDPTVVEAFHRVQERFNRIYLEVIA